MRAGMAVIFQNPGRKRPDHEIYREELRLADLAEPLGFDSIWSVEHHFTDYTMCPDVLQFLTWMAGRTERLQLGSMVVVLPWHDPLRVAEQVAMLDAISGGRVILGLGRGAGKVEFDGFRLRMDESRQRFLESAASTEASKSAAGNPSSRSRTTPPTRWAGTALAAACSATVTGCRNSDAQG